jgi:hypothetical protein
MKLPIPAPNLRRDLKEFDIWMTPSLGETPDTEKFKEELARVTRPFSETPGRNNGQQSTDLPPTMLSSSVVLWDKGPFDEENTLVPSARTADDFVLTSSATIQTITFDIYADTPGTQSGAVDIYTHSGGIGPVNALPLATCTSTTFAVVGSGFGYDIRRYKV